MTPEPDARAHFGVELLEDFGGVRNHHWLVRRNTERLVLKRWATNRVDLEWEVNLLEQVHALGWPVARVLETFVDAVGVAWSLHPHLPGAPATDKNSPREGRSRGRLLAAFHRSPEALDTPQRTGWRRCEAMLSDPTLEATFQMHARTHPEEARAYLWHLDEAARALIAPLEPASRPSRVVHGDFTQWNLLFSAGRLTGILDFELAHKDHCIADFALAWRGLYDDVILAYNELSPLEDCEWALLTPLWWASLLEGAVRNIRAGVRDDGWTMKMLLRRSRLMGDAPAFV